MRIIALINQKGGVGKTTTTVNIGAGLAKLGKRVLMVDLDPQANLTHSLGIQPHTLPKTVYQVLRGESTVGEAVIERDKGLLYLLPSTLDLSGAEIELSGEAGREVLLKGAIEEGKGDLRGVEYVLLDCPPSLGLLTLNALTTAQEVYIPLQTEYLALQGMTKLLETVEKVKARLNKGLSVTGIICTRYDARKKLNNEVEEKIREHFRERVFKTNIRDNVTLAEAPSFGKTIFEYRPDSHGAEDYLALCKEIIGRSIHGR